MRALSRQLPGTFPRRAGALVFSLSAGPGPGAKCLYVAADVPAHRFRFAAARNVAVQVERIGGLTSAYVQRALRQPGYLGGHRRREVSHKTQSS